MTGAPGRRSPRSRARSTMYRAARSLMPPRLKPSSLAQNPRGARAKGSSMNSTGVLPTALNTVCREAGRDSSVMVRVSFVRHGAPAHRHGRHGTVSGRAGVEVSTEASRTTAACCRVGGEAGAGHVRVTHTLQSRARPDPTADGAVDVYAAAVPIPAAGGTTSAPEPISSGAPGARSSGAGVATCSSWAWAHGRS